MEAKENVSSEVLVVPVADADAKAAVPPVMSTYTTSREAGTVSPGQVHVKADGLVSSSATRTETEAGLVAGSGFGLFFVDFPGSGITGSLGMDKLERV